MTPFASGPEQKARAQIDAALSAAGWIVQDRDEMNLSAGRGVAVREFKLTTGFGFRRPPVLRIPNVQNQAISLDDMKFATESGTLRPDGVVESGSPAEARRESGLRPISTSAW